MNISKNISTPIYHVIVAGLNYYFRNKNEYLLKASYEGITYAKTLKHVMLIPPVVSFWCNQIPLSFLFSGLSIADSVYSIKFPSSEKSYNGGSLEIPLVESSGSIAAINLTLYLSTKYLVTKAYTLLSPSNNNYTYKIPEGDNSLSSYIQSNIDDLIENNLPESNILPGYKEGTKFIIHHLGSLAVFDLMRGIEGAIELIYNFAGFATSFGTLLETSLSEDASNILNYISGESSDIDPSTSLHQQ